MGCFFSSDKNVLYERNPLRLCYVYFSENASFKERTKFIEKAKSDHPLHKETKIYHKEDMPYSYLIISPPKHYSIEDIKFMAKHQNQYQLNPQTKKSHYPYG